VRDDPGRGGGVQPAQAEPGQGRAVPGALARPGLAQPRRGAAVDVGDAAGQPLLRPPGRGPDRHRGVDDRVHPGRADPAGLHHPARRLLLRAAAQRGAALPGQPVRSEADERARPPPAQGDLPGRGVGGDLHPRGRQARPGGQPDGAVPQHRTDPGQPERRRPVERAGHQLPVERVRLPVERALRGGERDVAARGRADRGAPGHAPQPRQRRMHLPRPRRARRPHRRRPDLRGAAALAGHQPDPAAPRRRGRSGLRGRGGTDRHRQGQRAGTVIMRRRQQAARTTQAARAGQEGDAGRATAPAVPATLTARGTRAARKALWGGGRLRRSPSMLVVALAFLLVPVGSAWADPTDEGEGTQRNGFMESVCPGEPAPYPEMSGNGPDGELVPPQSRDALAGSPDGTLPDQSLYGQYGTSGLQWHVIRENCMSKMGDSAITTLTNTSWDLSKTINQSTITVYQAATSDGLLANFNRVVENAVAELREGIWRPLLPTVFILGAVWLGWYGLIRKRVTLTIESTVWMVLATAIGLWILVSPGQILNLASQVVNSGGQLV